MRHYCTLFDSRYLTRGIALYHSLRAHHPDCSLYVLCFDGPSLEILHCLSLPGVVPVSLEEFETPALLRVKSSRTRGEYCWTCTSHWIRHVLEAYAISEVTYLDADLFFFDSPEALHDEFATSGGSVLLTEHRYTPRFDLSSQKGIYCVQFMTFCYDERGIEALSWWQERCLEWCFNRNEKGLFGDQKYLDDWDDRFAGIHVLRNTGGGVAPWNVQQYRVTFEHGKPFVDQVPVIFYHFHGLKLYEDGSLDLTDYPLSPEVIDALYRPYFKALEEADLEVRTVVPGFFATRIPKEQGMRPLARSWIRRMKGTFNEYRSL